MATPPFALYLKEVDVVHLLAFVGGFVDTAGYLRLLGVFTSSITGNLVVATASVASMRGVICRSFVCVAFFLSGGVSSALSMRLRLAHGLSQRFVCCLIFAGEIALIVASWIIGNAYDKEMLVNTDIDSWTNVLVGCLLGASMGFHNVAAKEAITNCPPTTVMTSTMINVAQNLSTTIEYGLASHSLLRLQPVPAATLTAEQKTALVKSMTDKYRDALGKFTTTAKPLAAFIVGCVIGAVTMDRGSWHCLAIPCAVLLAIIGDALLQWQAVRAGAAAAAVAAAASARQQQQQAVELEQLKKANEAAPEGGAVYQKLAAEEEVASYGSADASAARV